MVTLVVPAPSSMTPLKLAVPTGFTPRMALPAMLLVTVPAPATTLARPPLGVLAPFKSRIAPLAICTREFGDKAPVAPENEPKVNPLLINC